LQTKQLLIEDRSKAEIAEQTAARLKDEFQKLKQQLAQRKERAGTKGRQQQPKQSKISNAQLLHKQV
jgi:hypothetical protein